MPFIVSASFPYAVQFRWMGNRQLQFLPNLPRQHLSQTGTNLSASPTVRQLEVGLSSSAVIPTWYPVLRQQWRKVSFSWFPSSHTKDREDRLGSTTHRNTKDTVSGYVECKHSVGLLQARQLCSMIFAPGSKAHFHRNSQSGELLNYEKNIQLLKLYCTSQQLPLVSTTAPFLPSLLLFVCSSISFHGQHPFPEQPPCWHPTPEVAAPLTCVPPITTGFLSSPRRHTAIPGSPRPLSCARFPNKLSVFQ